MSYDTKSEVLIVWPGAVHASIGVKLNPQVYSSQQQILANFVQISRHLGKWRPRNLCLPMDGHGRR